MTQSKLSPQSYARVNLNPQNMMIGWLFLNPKKPINISNKIGSLATSRPSKLLENVSNKFDILNLVKNNNSTSEQFTTRKKTITSKRAHSKTKVTN